MIHQPLSPDEVHSQISSSLRLLVLCLIPSKNSYRSSASLTNATLVFSTLWLKTHPDFAIVYFVGRREQLNQATSYIDASYLYGNDLESISKMRSFHGGKPVIPSLILPFPTMYFTESVDQDQPAHMCSQILLCTVIYSDTNSSQRNPIQCRLNYWNWLV